MSAKPSKSKKTKLSFGNLALLEWLCERPYGRMFTNHNINPVTASNVTYLFEMGDPDENGKRKIARHYPSNSTGGKADEENVAFMKRFGGKVGGPECYRLSRAGFTRSLSALNSSIDGKDDYDRFIATLERQRNPFHFSELLYFLTEAGLEYWKTEGRAEMERLRAEAAEKRESADRLVLLGVQSRISPQLPKHVQDAVRAGIPLPSLDRKLVRPYALVRVVKETANRLYVEDVEYVRKGQGSVYGIIEGRAPNMYVSKEHVMLDNATRPGVAKVLDMDAEYVDEAQKVMLDAIERILPILREADLRLKQKAAGHDDMMKELLESLGKEADDQSPAPGTSGTGAKPRRRR